MTIFVVHVGKYCFSFSNIGSSFFSIILLKGRFVSFLKMAKRLVSSEVNWTFILETLMEQDRSKLMPLKIATDKYLREMVTKPAELPKIDWNSYKSKITAPGMVDSFQKAYESLKIPYPPDQGAMAKAEELNARLIKHADEKEIAVSNQIKEFKKKLIELESVMPYSDMTVEEYFLAKPEDKIDLDNPTPYPRIEDEFCNDEN